MSCCIFSAQTSLWVPPLTQRLVCFNSPNNHWWRIGDEPVGFDCFEFWGNIRGVCQVLAFGVNLWALVAALRSIP